MASVIRWRRKDEEELKKAVRNFNNKITRLEKKGFSGLPQKVSYKTLRKGKKMEVDEFGNIISARIFPILSRREYNNQINSLKRWTRKNAEELVTLESGLKVTKWEKQEAIYKQIRATRSLNKAIGEKRKGKKLSKARKKVLKGVKEHIGKVNISRGYERERILDLLDRSASADRELKKATVWYENFMGMLDTMEYDNKEILIAKMKSFDNPINAYEYISKAEQLVDLFDYYKDTAGSQTYGGFDSNQEAFDSALIKLGLL